MTPPKKKSFTLVEMVVVVVLIGLLAASLIPKFLSAESRTRDVVRKKDVYTISQGLHLYHVDIGKFPPAACNAPQSVINGYRPGACRRNQPQATEGPIEYSLRTGFLTELIPGYLTSMPKDPLSDQGYTYSYSNTETGDVRYIETHCNIGSGGIHEVVGIQYTPERKLTSDYFRSCPDGKPRDSLFITGWDSTKFQRGIRIFDNKAIAVGDNKRK